MADAAYWVYVHRKPEEDTKKSGDTPKTPADTLRDALRRLSRSEERPSAILSFTDFAQLAENMKDEGFVKNIQCYIFDYVIGRDKRKGLLYSTRHIQTLVNWFAQNYPLARPIYILTPDPTRHEVILENGVILPEDCVIPVSPGADNLNMYKDIAGYYAAKVIPSIMDLNASPNHKAHRWYADLKSINPSDPDKSEVCASLLLIGDIHYGSQCRDDPLDDRVENFLEVLFLDYVKDLYSTTPSSVTKDRAHLHELRGIDAVICVGDIISKGASASEKFERYIRNEVETLHRDTLHLDKFLHILVPGKHDFEDPIVSGQKSVDFHIGEFIRSKKRERYALMAGASEDGAHSILTPLSRGFTPPDADHQKNQRLRYVSHYFPGEGNSYLPSSLRHPVSLVLLEVAGTRGYQCGIILLLMDLYHYQEIPAKQSAGPTVEANPAKNEPDGLKGAACGFPYYLSYDARAYASEVRSAIKKGLAKFTANHSALVERSVRLAIMHQPLYWSDKEHEAFAEYLRKICVHEPLEDWRKRDLYQILAVESRFHAIICGHAHVSDSIDLSADGGNIHQLILPSLGALDTMDRNGYGVLQIRFPLKREEGKPLKVNLDLITRQLNKWGAGYAAEPTTYSFSVDI